MTSQRFVDFADVEEVIRRVLVVYGLDSPVVIELIAEATGWLGQTGYVCQARQTSFIRAGHECRCVGACAPDEGDWHLCPCGMSWRTVNGVTTMNSHKRVDRDLLKSAPSVT